MYKQIHFYLNLFACTSTYPNLCVYLQSCFKFKKSLMAPSNVCCFPFLFFLFVGIVSELGIYIKQKHLMNKGGLKSFQGSTAGLSSLGVPGVPWHGRSVNPISTRGDRLYPPNYYWQTRLFRPSDGPDFK